MTHHLVGAAEVAGLLGLSRQRVSQLSSLPGFPAPQAELASGRVWLREEIEQWIRDRGRQRAVPAMAELTPAEQQVLQRVATAPSIPEIAESLHISERTARNHLRSIVAKLTDLLGEDEGG